MKGIQWMHAKACLKQANNVLPKMHFSTSIQHVISTKTGAGIDSLKLAWLTNNKRWYSSTPLVMTRQIKNVFWCMKTATR
jgi:hypothetical protein